MLVSPIATLVAHCFQSTVSMVNFRRQVMEPGPSQLAAAVVSLIATLVARSKDSGGLLWLAWQASFSHWALQAYVIAEAERLTGEKLSNVEDFLVTRPPSATGRCRPMSSPCAC